MTIPTELKKEISTTFKSMDKVESLIVNLVIDYLAETGRLIPEWQPIETAPRDGKRFISTDDYNIEIIRWYNGTWVVRRCSDPFYDEEWDENTPTHWMPLPPAPKAGV